MGVRSKEELLEAAGRSGKLLEDVQKLFRLAKTARGRASRWSELGRNEEAVWGVAVDVKRKSHVFISATELHCSCGKTLPCKHALALGLMDADDIPIPVLPHPGEVFVGIAKARYYPSWE